MVTDMDRGELSKNAISPKNAPASSSANVAFSSWTLVLPLAMINRESPNSPLRMMGVQSGYRTSWKAAATASKSLGSNLENSSVEASMCLKSDMLVLSKIAIMGL